MIRRLAAECEAALLAVEVGAGQAATVAGRMGADTEILHDLAGIERVVVSRR